MRSTESGFNELVYLAASQENLTVARELLDSGRYTAASFFAGLAVEALLLAYQTQAGTEHDAGHSLFRLAENGQFWAGMSRKQKEVLSAELSEVALHWRNNHRYRSEQAYRDWLIRNRLFVVGGNATTSQDVVIFNAELLLEAAQRIIEAGVARWSPSSA